MSVSTNRSIPIAAAATAASIVSPAPPMPTSACRRVWISKPSCLYKADAVKILGDRTRQTEVRCKPIALGIKTDGYQPLEKRLRDHPRDSRASWPAAGTPAPSSPRARWWCAIIDLLADLARDELVVGDAQHHLAHATTSNARSSRGPHRRGPFARDAAAVRSRGPGRRARSPRNSRHHRSRMEDILAAAKRRAPAAPAMCCCACRIEVKTLFRDGWRALPGPRQACDVADQPTQGGKDYDSDLRAAHGAAAAPTPHCCARASKLARRKCGFYDAHRPPRARHPFVPPAGAQSGAADAGF